MCHRATFATVRRFRFLGVLIGKVCLAAVLVVCQSAFAQTPTGNPPTAPQHSPQPPIGEPIRPRVPNKTPNRNNAPQNPANPSNPDPNNAAAAQPVGNPAAPAPAQPGAAGAAQPTPTNTGQPVTQPLAPGQTGAAPANPGQLPILNQPGAPPVIPGAQPNPQGARTRTGAPNPTAPPQPNDDETVRKTREALTQPAVSEPPAGEDANKPATPDDSKKTPAQRAAERRKQLQGKTGDTAAGNPGAVPNPAVNPGFAGGEGDNPDAGPTKSINIPPAIADDVPPEKKTYSFSIKDGSYEQLVEGFARQTGMGIIGDIPKEGKVTFVTTESLSFDAALARIRMLLFNYKPHEPYWILREDTNLKVVRINDIYRVLPPDRMFRSVDAYKAAALGKDDLALVIYTPKSGSIADLRQVRDFLPDYVRIAPVENSNSVSIFALVSDIDKYLWLIDFFSNKEADPRTVVRIEVKHIAPSEALTRLSQLMSLDSSGVPKALPVSGRRPTGNPAQSTAIDSMPEPAVTVLPDDAQGILIVRAMQDKIDEIKFLLTYIDVEPSTESYKPTIIKLNYADAETVISAVQQVLQAAGSSTPGAVPAPNPAPKANKGKRPRAAGPSATTDEGQIRMFAHPTDNAIVVLADDAGVQHVRDLIPLFDVKTHADWVRIPVENIDPADASNTLTTVLIGIGGGKQGKGPNATMERFQLVLDPRGGALFFSGEQKDLETVRDVLKTIDVREDPVKIHTVFLRRQTPSFIASMLREMDQNGSGGGATAPVTSKKSKKQAGGATSAVVASKFTADDGQKKLYVLCTEKEWQKYKPLIEELENQKDDEGQQYVRIAIKSIEPQDAVNKITEMLTAAGEDVVNMVPANGSILVFDTDPKTIDRLNLFLGEIDKPSSIVERTFEIRHANPADIKTAIDTLVGEAPSNKVPKARKNRDKQGGGGVTTEASVTEELTVLQVGERLVVRTSPKKMEQVAKIVEQFDVVDSRTEMKVYSDFPRGTDIAGIAETIRGVMLGGGAKPTGKRSRGEGVVAGTIDGPQFIPQPAAGKLIVIAEPSQFVEVEKLLNVLRGGVENAPAVVEFIELKYTDPAELVDAISPLVEIKVRQLVAAGELPDENSDDSAPRATKKKGSITQFGGASGGSGNGRYHIAPDARNNRIVVAAPQVVVNEVRELVTQFDRPDLEKATPVFKTVELMNASPSEIVKAIGEMRGHGTSTAKGGKSKRGDAGDSSKSSVPFVIMEAPGGGSKIILQGTSEEVEQATGWIKKLDAEAATGRTIKVYEPKHAEIGKIVDFIINVVEATSGNGQGGAKGKPPKSSSKKKDKDSDSEEDAGFTTTRTYFGKDLYLQADLIGGRFMVAATQAKIRQIDDVMKQLDSDEEAIVGITGPPPEIPTHIYKLKYRKADSAVTDLDGILHDQWPDDKEPPEVHAGNADDTIVVRYPREERFPKIEELIRDLVDKPDKESLKVVRKSLPVPEGISPSKLGALLKIQNLQWNTNLVNKTPEDPEKLYPTIIPIKPRASAPSPCILPMSLRHMAEHGVLTLIGQPEDEPEPDDDQPVDDIAPEPIPPPSPPPRALLSKQGQPDGVPGDLLKRAGFPVSGKSKSETSSKGDAQKDVAPSEKKSDKKSSSGKGTKEKKKETEKASDKANPDSESEINIYVNDQDGSLVIEGPKEQVKEIQKWLDDLDKEALGPGEPDIRIYQVQYIDVYSAARVVEEMFNATSAQRNALATQQQMMQRQQQLAQQRQQPGQQGQGQEDPNNPQGARGRGGRQPQQPQVPQMNMQVPQLPPSTVRVYPNPRDRSLIFRADTSLYPQILKLLATVDQPKPIDSVLRTYPLQKLNAAEVEDWLKHMLGLKEAGAGKSRAPARTSPAPMAQGGIPGMGSSTPLITDEGGSLPETILQPTISGTNKLNIDPDDITLFSSDAGNAIMVMAPEAAQDYIKRLIEQLESGDIPERITKVYELKNAEAEDMADYLANYFAEKLGTPGGGKGKRPAAEPASSAGPHFTNTPTFVAYSRLNQLTVHATEKQMKEIDEIIERSDVSDGGNTWQNVALKYADAGLVAEILGNMFGGGSSGKSRASGGPAGSDKGGSNAAKFVGDPGGHILYFTAPKQLHEQILDKIQKMDDEARGAANVRVVQLKYAMPTAIAEAIDSALTGQKARGKSGGAPGGPSGGGASKSSGGAQFSVVGHDASKQLFVTADDPTFAKIQSLVATLDQPGMTSTVEFRIYPLQFANAKSVHGQMTKLLGDYIKRLAPGEKPQVLEAFSVEPDETSNSLVVLGSPAVFGFIEENLRKIDIPAAKVGQIKTANFTITNGNAGDIVQNIKALYANKDQNSGGVPAPVAEANTTANVVIVHGTESQILDIKRDIIDPLDSSPNRPQVKPIKLKFADPNAVADAIGKMFKSDGKNSRDQVTATGDYTSNSVLISASPENLKRVEDLIAQIDNAETAQQDVHVVEIKHADATAVAQTLNDIFVKSGQAKGAGAQGSLITIAAVQGSRAVLIKCKAEEFTRIAETIKELDTGEGATAGDVRVVTLSYSDAAEVAKSLEAYLTNATAAGGKGEKLIGGVRISAMPQSNSVMISAATEEVERLVEIVKNMDIAGEKGNVPQIIQLKYARVSQILPRVQEMFSMTGQAVPGGMPGAGGQQGFRNKNQPAPIITSDEASNVIIVRGTTSDFEAISKLVAQLDTKELGDNKGVRIVQVKPGINIPQLADQVETSMREIAMASFSPGQMRGATAMPTLIATPDTRLNAIMLAGSPSLLAQAEDLIHQIEALGPAANKATVVIPVTNYKVEEMQRLVEQLTQQQNRGRSGGAGRSSPSQPVNRPMPQPNRP